MSVASIAVVVVVFAESTMVLQDDSGFECRESVAKRRVVVG